MTPEEEQAAGLVSDLAHLLLNHRALDFTVGEADKVILDFVRTGGTERYYDLDVIINGRAAFRLHGIFQDPELVGDAWWNLNLPHSSDFTLNQLLKLATDKGRYFSVGDHRRTLVSRMHMASADAEAMTALCIRISAHAADGSYDQGGEMLTAKEALLVGQILMSQEEEEEKEDLPE